MAASGEGFLPGRPLFANPAKFLTQNEREKTRRILRHKVLLTYSLRGGFYIPYLAVNILQCSHTDSQYSPDSRFLPRKLPML